MRTINFTLNWNNKLDNKVFTTIRSRFMPIEPNTAVEIHLKGRIYCWATVKECILCKFADINPLILWLDTGHTPEECIKIFSQFGINTSDPNAECMLMIFERRDKPLNEQIRDVLKLNL